MKKILLLFTILTVSVITTACINNLAIQELNNKAESYLNKGDTEAAICRLKSSLDLDNGIYQTHYNLSVAYNNIKNYNGAIFEANKVLELNPEFFDAYYIIATAQEAAAYEMLNDTQEGDMPDLVAASDFNSKAQEAIDSYNRYLENVPNAVEADKINKKISELNKKIKELTNYYDKQTNKKSVQQEQKTAETNEPDETKTEITEEQSE